MDWQWLAVAIIVGLAVVYLVHKTGKVWIGAKGTCGGACSCAAKDNGAIAPSTVATIIPVDELRLRPRPSGSSRKT